MNNSTATVFLGSKEVVKSLFYSVCKRASKLVPWQNSGEMPSSVLTGTLILPHGLVGNELDVPFFFLNC